MQLTEGKAYRNLVCNRASAPPARRSAFEPCGPHRQAQPGALAPSDVSRPCNAPAPDQRRHSPKQL